MKILRKVLVPVLLLMAVIAQSAQSAIIPTLFSTGVDSSGNQLASGSIDPHYELIAVPPSSGYSSSTYTADTTADPVNTIWANPGSTARWIGPVTDVVNMPSATTTGDYVYKTTFDLTGFDPTTAVITGQWTADDVAPLMTINSVSTGYTISGSSASATLNNFTISSGFIAGLNTLQFTVSNVTITGGLNPSGLLVIMSGTATAVPEPASIALFSLGAISIALANRGRRKIA